MPLQARWFGLSLVLHLAVGAAFIATISRHTERAPRVITVTLEDLAMPQARRPAADTAPKTALVKPATVRQAPDAVATPVTSRVEEPRTAPHTEAPRNPVAQNFAEVKQPKPPAASAPERPVQSAPPAAAAVVRGVHAPAAADERPTPEKMQHRYVKEHFAYIRDMIAQKLVYPPMARRMGWSGRTAVSFIILEDGSVQNIRVSESSGHQILDKSALESVRAAVPFPRPPVRADITVPVSFRISP